MEHFTRSAPFFVHFCLKICIYAIFIVPLHDFCYSADKAAMKTKENN